MNRYTFIRGFALLVIAATLAASITMRNEPGTDLAATRPGAGTPRSTHSSPPHAPANAATMNRQRDQATHQSAVLRVDLTEPWLTTLPAVEPTPAAAERAAPPPHTPSNLFDLVKPTP